MAGENFPLSLSSHHVLFLLTGRVCSTSQSFHFKDQQETLICSVPLNLNNQVSRSYYVLGCTCSPTWCLHFAEDAGAGLEQKITCMCASNRATTGRVRLLFRA